MASKRHESESDDLDITRSSVVIGNAGAMGSGEDLYRSPVDDFASDWRRLSDETAFDGAEGDVRDILKRLAGLPELITLKSYKQFSRKEGDAGRNVVGKDVDALRADVRAIEFKLHERTAYLRVPIAVEPMLVGVLREIAPKEVRIFSSVEYELELMRTGEHEA